MVVSNKLKLANASQNFWQYFFDTPHLLVELKTRNRHNSKNFVKKTKIIFIQKKRFSVATEGG